MKILIVDDHAANRLLVTKMLAKWHEFVYAENGRQALELAVQEEPDLILMDVLMPEMDGVEATVKIREIYTHKWMPIVILSALADEEKIIAGLVAGADDYLTKPLNREMLLAKVNTMQRSILMQKNLLEANKQLTEYQQRNEAEYAFTKDIFDQLIKYKDFQDDGINYWLCPSKCFSGDLISIKRIDSERLYFIVADATGHGLAASLPTIIVNQVFQSMTGKQFLVSSIAKEINNRLRTDMPCGRFVALAIGMLDMHNKTIEVWNGGLPELVAINSSGEIAHRFQSKHVASGILDDNAFGAATDIWQWTEPCELFAYTDGVTDVLNHEHKEFGELSLFDVLLQHQAGERLAALKSEVINFMDNGQEQDDVSCLSILCA
ncbi:MAG: response regulator [Methyloprofundus sp.]|nr:response regulator [Methyloprofundus sp.]MBW6452185.1 response regulator [Methyloprofundus sp.]